MFTNPGLVLYCNSKRKIPVSYRKIWNFFPKLEVWIHQFGALSQNFRSNNSRTGKINKWNCSEIRLCNNACPCLSVSFLFAFSYGLISFHNTFIPNRRNAVYNLSSVEGGGGLSQPTKKKYSLDINVNSEILQYFTMQKKHKNLLILLFLLT